MIFTLHKTKETLKVEGHKVKGTAYGGVLGRKRLTLNLNRLILRNRFHKSMGSIEKTDRVKQ